MKDDNVNDNDQSMSTKSSLPKIIITDKKNSSDLCSYFSSNSKDFSRVHHQNTLLEYQYNNLTKEISFSYFPFVSGDGVIIQSKKIGNCEGKNGIEKIVENLMENYVNLVKKEICDENDNFEVFCEKSNNNILRELWWLHAKGKKNIPNNQRRYYKNNKMTTIITTLMLRKESNDFSYVESH